MNKTVLIIVCSGSNNKGTEALVRGTIELLTHAFDSFEVTLASSSPKLDSKLLLPNVVSYIPRETVYRKLSGEYLYNKIRKELDRRYKDFTNLVECAKSQDLVLVVGADNYDVAYKLYPGLHRLNVLLRKNCKGKLFLYDCSLNKESVTEQFIKEAMLFDAFSVREQETLENIRGKYVGDNLLYFPDPAFVMPPKEVPLPPYWKTNHMIGVNLSTLIVGTSYGEGLHDKVVASYKFMIDKALEDTPYDVVLIPHVMRRKDLAILEEIKNLYPNNERVNLIANERYTAPELKYIISQCRFFIGARTHATIAAYSSCVPTLVLGYSTKSIGIAKDLFNTDEGYVVPVQKIKEKDDLWKAFSQIMNNEELIKAQLKKRIPLYQQEVFRMSDVFKKLLGE